MTTRPRQERPQKPARSSGHLTVRPEGEGADVRALFEQSEDKRIGGAVGASIVGHVVVIVALVLIARFLPEQVYQTILPERLSDQIVWLSQPGPGGGGGGGNRSPEPPKPAELPGKEKISVPVKPPEPIPAPAPEPEPEPQLTIPAQVAAAAPQISPGAIDTQASNTDSRGAGTGTGAGPGQGSGLGPGFGGGIGGGAYRPGNGVQLPTVLQEVKPQYTAEAMRAKVQGTVLLECVVLPDGSVGPVEVVRSLDSSFGLDQEAVKAAKRWRFRPGTRFGEPVSVLVTIELTFTLR
jgi:periplasmic protein TonB